MNKDLQNDLASTASILELCGWQDKANWFKENTAFLQSTQTTAAEKKKIANSMKNILAGPGSFTDIPLTPPADSGYSRESIRKKQWKLANNLGVLLEKFIISC